MEETKDLKEAGSVSSFKNIVTRCELDCIQTINIKMYYLKHQGAIIQDF
jgi:hypothetical protein